MFECLVNDLRHLSGGCFEQFSAGYDDEICERLGMAKRKDGEKVGGVAEEASRRVERARMNCKTRIGCNKVQKYTGT